MIKITKSGCGEAWYRAWFGSKRPWVQIPPLGPNNDNPNYIIQVGNVFGFIISIENAL